MWEEFGYVMVNLTAGSSLGFGAPMPGPPESWRPPTEPALYLFVADVDATYATLMRKGVAFERAPENVPWGHRVALFKDPEGRTICIATRLGTP
jgi:uncharacterized glyoxalase superfamily protein PhnB